jgi:hypothetical protein
MRSFASSFAALHKVRLGPVQTGLRDCGRAANGRSAQRCGARTRRRNSAARAALMIDGRNALNARREAQCAICGHRGSEKYMSQQVHPEPICLECFHAVAKAIVLRMPAGSSVTASLAPVAKAPLPQATAVVKRRRRRVASFLSWLRGQGFVRYCCELCNRSFGRRGAIVAKRLRDQIGEEK